jgi:transposase InsO family protein
MKDGEIVRVLKQLGGSKNHINKTVMDDARTSFHAILKKEEVHQGTYLNFESASLALLQFIEGWNNRKRIHGR